MEGEEDVVVVDKAMEVNYEEEEEVRLLQGADLTLKYSMYVDMMLGDVSTPIQLSRQINQNKLISN